MSNAVPDAPPPERLKKFIEGNYSLIAQSNDGDASKDRDITGDVERLIADTAARCGDFDIEDAIRRICGVMQVADEDIKDVSIVLRHILRDSIPAARSEPPAEVLTNAITKAAQAIVDIATVKWPNRGTCVAELPMTVNTARRLPTYARAKPKAARVKASIHRASVEH